MTSLRRNNNQNIEDDGVDVEHSKLLEVTASPISHSEFNEDDNKVATSPRSQNKDGLSYSSMRAITSCLLYCFCSVSMVLVNKSLASRLVYLSFVNPKLTVIICMLRLQ